MELRIDGWRKGIRFSASHIIPGHEVCGHMHGHTYAVHVALEGDPADNGFIVDFNEVVTILRRLTEDLDHCLILPTENPHLELKEGEDEVTFYVGDKRYVVPSVDVALLPIANASAEHLARYLCDRLAEGLAGHENLEMVELGVDEGYGKGAWARRMIE